MLEAHDTDAEIDKMHELFSSISAEEYPSEDISAAAWLQQKVRASCYTLRAPEYAHGCLCTFVCILLSTHLSHHTRGLRPRCWLQLMRAMRTTGVRMHRLDFVVCVLY
jgi:hypothetical protein